MKFPTYEYEGLRRVTYGEEGAQFVPVCPTCRRFVLADKDILINGLGEVKQGPNATCRACGRVAMPFEGYV